MNHSCLIQCVKAENVIKNLRIEITALKGKLRKKNILIGNYEKMVSELKRITR